MINGYRLGKTMYALTVVVKTSKTKIKSFLT